MVSGTSTTSGDNTFTTLAASGGGGGGGGGSVGVATSYGFPYGNGAAISPSSTLATTTTSTLEAEIASLTAELDALIAEERGTGGNSSSYVFTQNLSLWDEGPEVTALQKFLIQEDLGPAAQALAGHRLTLTFGYLTYRALIEFQKSVGITPATGYFGVKTRAWVNSHE